MKLEQQVVSLELAKKMKELGFKQESVWYYAYMSDSVGWKLLLSELTFEPHELISAYTTAELGAMLPSEIEQQYLSCYRVHYLHGTTDEHDEWECGYGEAMGGKYFTANTEADARAKMLIYLKENNLI